MEYLVASFLKYSKHRSCYTTVKRTNLLQTRSTVLDLETAQSIKIIQQPITDDSECLIDFLEEVSNQVC